MKRIILTIGTGVIIGLSAFSQSTAYMTAGFESIFSFANINYNGSHTQLNHPVGAGNQYPGDGE